MKNFKWTFLAYLLTFLLIFLSIKAFINEDALAKITQFSLLDLILILILTFSIYVTSGVQLALITKEIGVNLESKDVLFLPIVLNLWSFLIPFQGSLLFSTFYLNSKYKSGLKASLSVSLFVYVLTVFLTGLFGLIFLVTLNYESVGPYVVTIALLSIPFILILLIWFKRFLLFRKNRLLSFLSGKLFNILETILALFKNHNLFCKVSFIKVFRTLLIGCWYYSITHALGINLSFWALVLLGLIVDLSIVVKITPDNLGVNQFLSGAIFSLLKLNSNDAVLVTLIASAASILIVFTIGMIANYFFLKSLSFSGIGEFIKHYKHSK